MGQIRIFSLRQLRNGSCKRDCKSILEGQYRCFEWSICKSVARLSAFVVVIVVVICLIVPALAF